MHTRKHTQARVHARTRAHSCAHVRARAHARAHTGRTQAARGYARALVAVRCPLIVCRLSAASTVITGVLHTDNFTPFRIQTLADYRS